MDTLKVKTQGMWNSTIQGTWHANSIAYILAATITFLNAHNDL